MKPSELVLNEDGTVYHLHLKAENISNTIILVGDQNRVQQISKHFDSIEFETAHREFKTHTGIYKNKRITVISTGIGPGNIDIVLNELDALVNIDFSTRKLHEHLKSLDLIRAGTSGSLQKNIPINSFVMSTQALDLNGMLHHYQIDEIRNHEIEEAFIKHTNWDPNKANPIVIDNSKKLELKFESSVMHKGLTGTSSGFYGPQGRVLRLPLKHEDLNSKIDSFNHDGVRVTNFEMETSAIYGLAKLLGHNAISLSAILANRADGTFSDDPNKVVEDLITYVLDNIGD